MKKSNIILIIVALLYITNEIINYFVVKEVTERVVERQVYDNR
jgi:hypothetical protein